MFIEYFMGSICSFHSCPIFSNEGLKIIMQYLKGHGNKLQQKIYAPKQLNKYIYANLGHVPLWMRKIVVNEN